MKKTAELIFLLSVALSSVASAADSKSVLAELRTALHHVRSSHSEEESESLCSTKFSELVGLSKKTILDALGNPDLNEDVVSRDSDPFSRLHYYLRPGGTTVTFTLGASNVVTSVSCA